MKLKFMNKSLATLLVLTLCGSLNAMPTEGKKCHRNSDPLSRIMWKRHSGRSYDASRPVAEDQLRKIVKSARLSPSSFNDQPWAFIICDKTTNPDAYDKAFSTLVEFNQGWAKDASVLIVSVASVNSAKDNSFNRWAEYDTGAATYGMMLQATSLGLMAHQMGGFDAAKMTEVFNIPEGFTPMSVMAVGYAAETNEKPAKKERKPLGENFFNGSWGTAYSIKSEKSEKTEKTEKTEMPQQ